MKLDNLIKQIVSKEMRDGGFNGGYKVEQTDEKPHVSGQINTQGFNQIEIGYNPEYEQIRQGALPLLVRDVSRHEINHRGYKGFHGCPRNLENHVEKIYEPIAEVLEAKRFGTNDAHYLANALEDTVLHADLGGKFALDGIAEFFSDVGRSTENSRYSPFYDAHVKLNMLLWGNKRQKQSVRKHFVIDKEKQKQIAEIMKKFLEKSGLSYFKRDKRATRAFLNDEDNWEKVARAYAEEFSQLMEPSYALPIINHSGKGTKGREKES